MNVLAQANWIWENSSPAPDEHADFLAKFKYSSEMGKVFIYVSADSDFGLYVNGQFVTFGQYPDYPHYKVYETIDITDYLNAGDNYLALEVWYYGNNCSTNIDDGAGVCFAVKSERETLLLSDESVLSRISKTYKSHACTLITGQLGYTYSYDATLEDDWKAGNTEGFSPSVKISPEKILPSLPRPIKRLEIGSAQRGQLIKSKCDEKFRYLFDFGRETVGIYTLKFNSPSEQNIELCYGEHIEDGWVRDKIHGRRFILDYRSKEGKNDYLGYFRRLGLRYAELRSELPLENVEIEILPVNYPLTSVPFSCSDPELQKIYDVCEDTLRLCLHDHYEDCPWREQAMYVLDSRNQMLCGYYSFAEFEFPKACIKLIAKDRRPDDMLSITYPGASGLVIPSFGLHFFTTVREYGDHSNDWDFVREIFPKLESLLNAFTRRAKDDSPLIPVFKEACYWNFYEWEKGLGGVIGKVDDEIPDLIINELYSIALQNMQYICDKLSIKADYASIAARVNHHINAKFFSGSCGLYGMYSPNGIYSELGQALAVLCGAAVGDTADAICNLLCDSSSDLTKTTLSMKGFKYDALLKVDPAYSNYIIEDIRRIYTKMLSEGATSVWETEDGASAFGNAGSLCHGWSALPIYYFHRLANKIQ